MTRSRPLMAIVLSAALVAISAACRRADTRRLRPVSLPDLSLMEQSARDQVQQQYAALESKIHDRTTTADDLGNAFGELGKLFLATEYLDAAEPCLLNAVDLTPGDARWPYYVGHLYKTNNRLDRAVAFFEKTLQLQPASEAALVWLGNVYLDQGNSRQAEAQFARVLAIHPDAPAGLYGLGRAVLARGDYQRAVASLEEAVK